MQKFNYHTHTYRCNHALGNDEDYIEEAIKLGLKTLGFSDHVPYPKDNGGNSRMFYKEIHEYLETMNNLKLKYQDKIDIKIGFECEYFDELLEYYQELRTKCDYLLLGQHMGKISKNADYFYSFTHNDYADYERLVIKGIKSGLFAYLCHPDVILNGANSIDEDMIKMFERIFKVAKEYNVPIEINFGGLNKKEKMINGILMHPYPNREIIKIAQKEGCHFVYGADAHRIKDITSFYERINYVKEEILKDIDYELEDLKI